jgi:uncharacterized iron-regulated membrane protein
VPEVRSGPAGPPTVSAAAPAAPAAPAGPGRRRRPLRVRAMSLLRVSHRWVSIVAGVLLLAITTSGAILLFEPELRQVSHPARWDATHADRPVTLDAAATAARRAYPRAGDPTRVVRNRGVFQVALGETPETLVNVDPGTGRVLGAARPERGVLGFLVNLHECGLTCEGYPGSIAALNAPMPDVGIQGVDKVTIGSFVLATFGIVLLLLVLSGVVLWWPGVRSWRRGFQVRRHKGRYGRDYDLHKLVGVVALPFLGMWAITGMNFELPERAVAAAQREADGGRFVGVNLPDPADAAATYLVWFSHGVDPIRYSDYPGGLGIGVDRHSGRAEVLYGAPGRPLRQVAWGDWTTGAHFGMFMGWIPRLLWLVLGLTPLLLAITGMSTWLYKRGKKRARKRRRAASAAPA